MTEWTAVCSDAPVEGFDGVTVSPDTRCIPRHTRILGIDHLGLLGNQLFRAHWVSVGPDCPKDGRVRRWVLGFEL